MTVEQDEKDFKDAFINKAKLVPGVTKVAFFGSFNTPRWKIGKSDIDIFIEGHVSPENKKLLRKEVIYLNNYYDLHLEDSCYLHPIPVFEDDKVTGKEFKALAEGKPLPGGKIFQELSEVYRPAMKKLCIPHKLAWKVLLDE